MHVEKIPIDHLTDQSPHDLFLSPASYCPPLPAGPASNQDLNVPWGGIVRQVEQGSLRTGTCLGLNSRDFETPKSCTKVGVRVHSHRVSSDGPTVPRRLMDIDFLIRYLNYSSWGNNTNAFCSNRGPAPNDTIWLNITASNEIWGFWSPSGTLNTESDSKSLFYNKNEDTSRFIIGFNGVAPIKSNTSTPQIHTLNAWYKYDGGNVILSGSAKNVLQGNVLTIPKNWFLKFVTLQTLSLKCHR